MSKYLWSNAPKLALGTLCFLPFFAAGCAAGDSSGSDAEVGGATGAVGGASAVGGAGQSGGALGVGGATTTARGGNSSSGGASTVGSGGATSASTGGATSAAPTWSQLWTNYFQGACASCHASTATSGNGLVFTNAQQLCTVLTNRRQLNGTTNPTLISTTQSVLNWFNTNGSMPEGSTTAPANAVRDIRAWAAAGAVCP